VYRSPNEGVSETLFHVIVAGRLSVEEWTAPVPPIDFLSRVDEHEGTRVTQQISQTDDAFAYANEHGIGMLKITSIAVRNASSEIPTENFMVNFPEISNHCRLSSGCRIPINVFVFVCFK